MIKNIIKFNRLSKGIALVGFMVYSTIPVLANHKKSAETSALSQPTVNLLSTDAGGAVLSVQFENKNKAAFTVTLHDEGENTMYRQKFQDSAFSKTFKVLNNDSFPAKTTVTIVVEGGGTYVYDVNTKLTYVRTVSVNKQ